MDAVISHGAPTVTVYVGDEFFAWGPYGLQLAAANADAFDGQARGLSCMERGRNNHAVNIVGWTPCMVRGRG